MELMVNGAKVENGTQWSQMTLEQTLKLISEDHVPEDEVITDVTVDGHLLSSEQEEKLSGHTMEGIELLEVATAKPSELARDGLQEALGYMDNLIDGLSKVAELFRQDKAGEALRLFQVALEGMSWFASLVAMGERYNSIDYRNLTVGGITVSDHYVDMGKIVRAFSEIQKHNDWKEAAVYIEEQLIPHFELWKEMIPEMIAGAESYEG